MKKIKNQRGFSLFEILVVMALFVLVVVVANQAFFTSLRGQNKSEATTNVKQNANFVISTMQRALHSAQGTTTCTPTTIAYYDSTGRQQTFACTGGTVTHSGAIISTDDITVSSCNFSCPQVGGKSMVNLNMTFDQAGSENLRVEEKSTYQVQTQVRLRN